MTTQSVNVPDTGYAGGGDPFAGFRKNPGTRVIMTRDERLTKKGVLEKPGFQFPAPPLDELTRTLTANWSDYDTISAGQFSRPGSMQLQAISFNSIVVCDEDGYVYPWAFYNPWNTRSWDTARVVRELGIILRAQTPFWLTVDEVRFKLDPSGLAGGVKNYRTQPVLRMLATLRSLSSTDRAGEPDAKYVSLSFTEHRRPDEQVVSGKGLKNPRLPASIPFRSFQDGRPRPPGFTLHDLAVYYYGSAAKWRTLKAANHWLGNITASHNLGNWDTAALKAAGKANRKLSVPRAAGKS